MVVTGPGPGPNSGEGGHKKQNACRPAKCRDGGENPISPGGTYFYLWDATLVGEEQDRCRRDDRLKNRSRLNKTERSTTLVRDRTDLTELGDKREERTCVAYYPQLRMLCPG